MFTSRFAEIHFCDFLSILKCHITFVFCFVMLHQRRVRTFDFTVFQERELNDQWIAKICRDERDYFAVTESTRVCSKHFCEEDYKVSEDGKGKKIVLKKGAVPTIFKWSCEKRSRSTFVSKGRRKGEDFEALRKKRQRKSCPHCERKQAAIDRLQSDLEEKNAQLK